MTSVYFFVFSITTWINHLRHGCLVHRAATPHRPPPLLLAVLRPPSSRGAGRHTALRFWRARGDGRCGCSAQRTLTAPRLSCPPSCGRRAVEAMCDTRLFEDSYPGRSSAAVLAARWRSRQRPHTARVCRASACADTPQPHPTSSTWGRDGAITRSVSDIRLRRSLVWRFLRSAPEWVTAGSL